LSSENRFDAIPRKCLVFFTAEANRAESSISTTKYFDNLGKNPSDLYDFLSSRFSGRESDKEIINNYQKADGLNNKLYKRLKQELDAIEINGNTIPGVKFSPGQGWLHFKVNEGTTQHDCKAYISFDYTTFTGTAFLFALKKLAGGGFKGQIKVADNPVSLLKRADNIVIHGEKENKVVKAAELVVQALESQGIRIGGDSRQSKINIAKDIHVPELKYLGKKAHQTSFSEGIAEIACEMLVGSIAASKQHITSYSDVRTVIAALFAEDGQFATYVKGNRLNK